MTIVHEFHGGLNDGLRLPNEDFHSQVAVPMDVQIRNPQDYMEWTPAEGQRVGIYCVPRSLGAQARRGTGHLHSPPVPPPHRGPGQGPGPVSAAEWWRAADGDGYTSGITRADPWDITRKHTARDWVQSGEEPNMAAALARYNRENPRGRRDVRYMGGKSRIAKKIREHLVSHGATKYMEPFVGGGAVLTVVARDFEFILAADAHADLIAMYQAIQDGSFTPPSTVSEDEYQALKKSDPSPLRTFAAFGASFGGKEWGGYARMGTATRNGKPRAPENYVLYARNSLAKSAKAGMFDPHITFVSADVFTLDLPEDLSGTVIYCDPPYGNTTGYKTGRFDTTKAWELFRSWSARGAHVYVSEYSGPESFLVDTFTPQGSMGKEQRNRVTEKLFYIPPTQERHMTKPNPFRPEPVEAPADPEPVAEELERDPIQNPEDTDPPEWVLLQLLQRWQARRGATEDRPPVAETMAEVLADADPPLTVTVDRWVAPNIHQLPRVDVPDHQAYYPHISAWLATGQPARDAVDQVPDGAVVAIDTETMGLGADSFTLKCLTAAWETANGTVSVLLDPTRRDDDRQAVRDLLGRAGTLVLQNAAFDVPPLHQNGLMSLADIAKVHDTVIYARMAYPDNLVNKSLESLATKLVEFPESEVTMAQLFKANGLTTAEGFRVFDIDKPIYRLGAMADTVATLRLLAQIQAKAWSRLAEGHPFGEYGVDSDGAVALMEREQEVNRIMLRRSARGLQVDTDYLATYEETHAAELTAATDAIQNAGLDPDAGNLGFLLVTKLEERGELPADWPRTDSGRLRATKDDLPKLDHPLAASVRKVAELNKVTGYLTKVQDMVRVTGRVHPQVGILKASATGRMAYSWPELQQFPSDARPIIVSDTGLTSVDWSQIEPVVMANCAQDWGFLEPFEAGGDLYAPIVEAAGVTRKTAKVLLLAAMYGQGRNSMAAALGISTEEAQRLQAGMFSAMPTTRGFIDRLRQIGEDHGLIITADGRVLPIPKANGQVLAYKAVNYFCVTPDTRILTEDLRHVRAEEIRVGDGVVGFDEYSRDSRGRGTGKRFFRHATVTHADVTYKESVEIRTSDGKVTMCSDDHRWLVRRPGRQPRLAWVESKDLTPDMQLLSLGTWDTADTRDGGYLAGLYDGEGCLTNRTTTGRPTNLLFSQNKGAVMDGFLEAMDRLGLTYSYVPKAPGSTSTTDTVRVSGLARMMRTIGTLRPERFIARARDLYDGAELHTTRMMEGTPHVVSVTLVGKRKVLAIGTTTRTLVANGYLSHNCQGSAYSVLADTIVRLERAGLGDSIHLALHDELVVDTEAAEAVAEIMRTPPEFLQKWTGGRVPVFKTDANDMGRTWQYV